MTATKRIEQAFLQLEFAIKLMNLVELRKIDKALLDTETTIILNGANLIFESDSFHSYDDVILAAQNNYSITLGFTAIALEDALQRADIRNDPTDNSAAGHLRSLVYMIRCAFAHDMMTPRWCVSTKQKRVLNVKLASRTLNVDLLALDGRPLEDRHFGGVTAYYEIKDTVVTILQSANGRKVPV